MARSPVATFSQVEATMRALSHGGALLLALDADGRPNAMTIGWGTIGWIWGRPIMTVLVRPSRYTYGCVETSGEFTVAVLPKECAQELVYCGTQSGRSHDKIAELGLTPEPAGQVGCPLLAEAVVGYECLQVHAHDLVPDALEPALREQFYTAGDFHRVYYGEILAVTAVPDAAERVAG